MTRIAGVDEEVWSSLYLLNAENVSAKISSLVTSLEEIKSAIDARDGDMLKKILAQGRKTFEESKKTYENADIFVRNLK